MIKNSKQRDAILANLRNTTAHPTIESVYNEVKTIYPNISLATVYRNLALLEDIGEIQRVTSYDMKDHYDANTAEHPHFQCKYCGRIYDLEMDNLEFLKTLGEKSAPGTIEKMQLLYIGKCTECQTN